MEGVTCTTCRIILTNQEDHREHYKSDFHGYNLKRKLVKLDPVSLEVFESKKAEAEKISNEVHFSCICACCQKQFHSTKSYQKHLEGQNKKKSGNRQVEYEPLLACLFCTTQSLSLDENLKHMMQSHGFFVPNVLYVNNIEAMMAYMQKKIREGMICLFCNNQGVSFNSAFAVQHHMRDKQHCFINTEDDIEEYEDFYNWEESEGENEEAKTDKLEGERPLALPRPKYAGELTHTGELRLENGKILGTKDFARYYKQYYRPKPEYQQNLKTLLAEEYRTLAVCTQWAQAPKDRVLQARDVLASDLKQGMVNNGLMKHFRSQNPL